MIFVWTLGDVVRAAAFGLLIVGFVVLFLLEKVMSWWNRRRR